MVDKGPHPNPLPEGRGGLLEIIKDKIREHGPMDIATYMELCLGHPEHGYYMTRDPFGAQGDFTTAPEVSQLFGEMIGAWLADVWMKMGRPSECLLVECGPGRGTLMADIMRSTKNVPGFHDAVRVYLMEMSLILREAQSQRLAAYEPRWIDDLTELPSSAPVLLVANEFLDALPIRQLEHRDGKWFERRVSIDGAGQLILISVKADGDAIADLPENVAMSGVEGVFETSRSLKYYIKSANVLLKKQRGVALYVDYGHFRSAPGDTLQCVRTHRPASLFDTPGLCDITAHVDFENVANIAKGDGVNVHGPVEQGAFLRSLGIEERAERLWAVANEAQKESINSGLFRLIDTSQMGSLFKVIALSSDSSIVPEGFNEAL